MVSWNFYLYWSATTCVTLCKSEYLSCEWEIDIWNLWLVHGETKISSIMLVSGTILQTPEQAFCRTMFFFPFLLKLFLTKVWPFPPQRSMPWMIHCFYVLLSLSSISYKALKKNRNLGKKISHSCVWFQFHIGIDMKNDIANPS